jgi:hypothetical protein
LTATPIKIEKILPQFNVDLMWLLVREATKGCAVIKNLDGEVLCFLRTIILGLSISDSQCVLKV